MTKSTRILLVLPILLALTAPTAIAEELKLPALKLQVLDGAPAEITELVKAADGPVLMVFWAVWAGPSKKLLNSLAEAPEDLKKDKKLEIIAVNVDEPRNHASAKGYVKTRDFKFKILLDPETKLMSPLNPSMGLPFTVVISPKGTIDKTETGYNPGDEDKLYDWIRSTY